MNKYTDYQLMVFEKPSLECTDVISLLGDYEDQDLPQSLHNRVEEHINDCDFCQDFEESYRGVIEVAAELRDKPVPRGVRSRLRSRLNDELGLGLEVQD